MFAVHPVPTNYRQPLVGALDPRFQKALTIASGLGVVFLLVVLIAPDPEPTATTVEELPERFARLIVEEAKPPAPVAQGPKQQVEVEAPPVEAAPEVEKPKATETPPPKTERRAPRQEKPKVAQDRGTAGRAKAKAEVTERLETVTASVDETLKDLAAVLPAAESAGSGAPATSRRRGGRVRSGRGAPATGSATARTTERGGAGGGEALAARDVDLSSYGAFDLSGVTGSASAVGSGGGGTDTSGDRSAADLMNVVRRYAPGIRFCYDSALESDASLRGKMVFRITVAADGTVADVSVAEDTLGSSAVRSCALTQIRAWRFGRAASASVFDAPFVFRPQG